MSGGTGSSVAVTVIVSALTAAVVTVATQLLVERHDLLDRLAPPPKAQAPQELLVPELTGLSRQGADVLLHERGLRMEVSRERPTTEAEPGTVLEQTPLPGSRVLRGAPVRIVVATGPAAVEMPAVIGQPLERARATLEGLGLKLGPVTEEQGGTPGSVLEAVPAAGQQVMPGQFVVLTVAAASVKVPKLVGERIRNARARLKSAGLKVGHTRERYDANRRAYVVLSQDPEAGAAAEPGSNVDLVINEGD